jgi:tetratricopeptide (TPR) repeat protein
MWSQRYDREMEDVFAIQDEITESIVKTLTPTLLGEQRPASRRQTDNVEAFQWYLKGRHLWQQRTQSALRGSIDYFQQAIAVDQDYALAHAGIADALCVLRVYGYVSEQESRSRAESASKRAMELDPGLGEAHFASAMFLLYYCEDWPAAEAHLREAVRISPRNALFHTYFGFFLAGRLRPSEAETEFSQGIELDPFSPLGYALYGNAMFMARRYEDAVRLGERSVELQPDFNIGLLAIGIALCRLGQHERAISVLERLAFVSNRNAWWVGHLGLVYAFSGRTEDALRIRAELEGRREREYIPPYAEVLVEIGLNDRDRIYQGLQKCIAERITGFSVEIVLGYYLDVLDDEPRFRELFSRLRLVQPRPR